MKERSPSKVCNTGFATKQKLRMHYKSVHEGKKTFSCNLSDTSFAESHKLIDHVASVHEGNELFKCDTCD